MNNMIKVLDKVIIEEVPGATVILQSSSTSDYGMAIGIKYNGLWMGMAWYKNGVVYYSSHKFSCYFKCELADPECFTRLGEAIRRVIPWCDEIVRQAKSMGKS